LTDDSRHKWRHKI